MFFSLTDSRQGKTNLTDRFLQGAIKQRHVNSEIAWSGHLENGDDTSCSFLKHHTQITLNGTDSQTERAINIMSSKYHEEQTRQIESRTRQVIIPTNTVWSWSVIWTRCGDPARGFSAYWQHLGNKHEASQFWKCRRDVSKILTLVIPLWFACAYLVGEQGSCLNSLCRRIP